MAATGAPDSIAAGVALTPLAAKLVGMVGGCRASISVVIAARATTRTRTSPRTARICCVIGVVPVLRGRVDIVSPILVVCVEGSLAVAVVPRLGASAANRAAHREPGGGPVDARAPVEIGQPYRVTELMRQDAAEVDATGQGRPRPQLRSTDGASYIPLAPAAEDSSTVVSQGRFRHRQPPVSRALHTDRRNRRSQSSRTVRTCGSPPSGSRAGRTDRPSATLG